MRRGVEGFSAVARVWFAVAAVVWQARRYWRVIPRLQVRRTPNPSMQAVVADLALQASW